MANQEALQEQWAIVKSQAMLYGTYENQQKTLADYLQITKFAGIFVPLKFLLYGMQLLYIKVCNYVA